MRSTVYFLPPRTSVTDSVGISTRPIFSSRPKARTRDSSDSLTLRSNPEYEWIMYHFMLGLRGFSATAAAVSDCGAPASVVASVLVSSCIVNPNLAFREVLDQIGNTTAKRVVDHPKIERKNEDRDDHNRR